MCLVNKTYNSYHDSHHFKTVVVIACMIAMSERLSERDRALLIIVALCHDFDHQGRRIISRPYYQEEISFQKFRRLFHKSIFRTSEINRIHKIFRNTYFPLKPTKTNDKLEKIVLDADILASLMFDISTGLNFAKRIKHELKMSTTSEELYKSFLKSIDNTDIIYGYIEKFMLNVNKSQTLIELFTLKFLWKTVFWYVF